MAFIKTYPIKKQFIDVSSTNTPEKQLWQELVAIRHLRKPIDISAKKATAPWIDQAKIYFIDACKSDWRSSGLLYYYSFLNLAKAYLAAKKSTSAKELKSTGSYHGLAANPQNPHRIIDFQFQIYPPVFKNRHNVFAKFYQLFTGSKWPYIQDITVKISDVIPYCREISTEVYNFYGIQPPIIYVYSLIRDTGSFVFFEISIPQDKQAIIQNHVKHLQLSSVDVVAMNNSDKSDWLTAYGRTMQLLQGTIFLRTPINVYNATNKQDAFSKTNKLALDLYGDYALPLPVSGSGHEFWQFVPKIDLVNEQIKWHPFLSDYLIAFALSSILRYQPHLLKPNSQDSYLAEAWCSQSAITALRYYLMALTTPSIRYN